MQKKNSIEISYPPLNDVLRKTRLLIPLKNNKKNTERIMIQQDSSIQDLESGNRGKRNATDEFLSFKNAIKQSFQEAQTNYWKSRRKISLRAFLFQRHESKKKNYKSTVSALR